MGVLDLRRCYFYFYDCTCFQSYVFALLFLFMLNVIYLIYSQTRANFYNLIKINDLQRLLIKIGHI